MATAESRMGAEPRDTHRDELYGKIGWRILPLVLLCYVFSYLDRVNIGFAKLQMADDIGISDTIFGLAAGIFFLGYVLFEIPSNLLLAKIGTRKTIVRILILWGLTSASMMFVQDETSFLIVRFLLGVFEAGFAPGIILYLTFWFPAERLAAPMALFLLAGPLGSMIGGPLSAWIITALDGAHGLAGWQWMFVIEGLPTVLLGLVVAKTLTNSPSEASWLSEADKALIHADVSAGHNADGNDSFREVLRDRRVFGLALSFFCLISGIYTVSFWLPTILTESGVRSTMTVGLYSALPYIAAIGAMIVLSRRSDRLMERRLHCAVPALVGAAALGLAAFTPELLAISLPAIIVATACIWGSYAVFWSIPPSYLSGTAAAGGIALINSIGLLGGFFSPTLTGYLKDATGNNETGLLVLVALLLLGGVGIAANRLPVRTQ